MRQLLIVMAALTFGACGEAPKKAPPIPQGAFDLTGKGAEDCTFFPDDCPPKQQCFLANEGPGTICGMEGARAEGESCDTLSGDPSTYCGRNLVCITFGSGASASQRCAAICNEASDCDGGGAGGAAPTCAPAGGSAQLSICVD